MEIDFVNLKWIDENDNVQSTMMELDKAQQFVKKLGNEKSWMEY